MRIDCALAFFVPQRLLKKIMKHSDATGHIGIAEKNYPCSNYSWTDFLPQAYFAPKKSVGNKFCHLIES